MKILMISHWTKYRSKLSITDKNHSDHCRRAINWLYSTYSRPIKHFLKTHPPPPYFNVILLKIKKKHPWGLGYFRSDTNFPLEGLKVILRRQLWFNITEHRAAFWWARFLFSSSFLLFSVSSRLIRCSKVNTAIKCVLFKSKLFISMLLKKMLVTIFKSTRSNDTITSNFEKKKLEAKYLCRDYALKHIGITVMYIKKIILGLLSIDLK